MSHFQFVLERTKQYKRSLYQGRFCLKFDRLLFAQENKSLSVKKKLKSRYFCQDFCLLYWFWYQNVAWHLSILLLSTLIQSRTLSADRMARKVNDLKFHLPYHTTSQMFRTQKKFKNSARIHSHDKRLAGKLKSTYEHCLDDKLFCESRNMNDTWHWKCFVSSMSWEWGIKSRVVQSVLKKIEWEFWGFCLSYNKP